VNHHALPFAFDLPFLDLPPAFPTWPGIVVVAPAAKLALPSDDHLVCPHSPAQRRASMVVHLKALYFHCGDSYS
jgi:hypothetical protein